MKTVDMASYNDILPINKLYQIAEENTDTYRHATPHAHGVFDDVFDPTVLHSILKEFDLREKEQWKEFDTKYEKKLQLNCDENLGPATRADRKSVV